MSRTLSFRTGRDTSVNLTVPARTALPVSSLKRLLLTRQNGEWTIAASTPIGGGYGRSLRAAILGLSYKSARRISGGMNSYLLKNFQDPSAPR